MKIHVISETPFIMKATGVHTAFINHIQLLREKNDIEVVINNEGRGDICHGHTYGLYYIWKGIKYKGKRVFTVHVIPDSIKGSLPMWRLFMPAVKLGLKIIYSYSDVCIAVSPQVEKAIRDTGAKTSIVKIYNPVDIDTWKRTEEKRERGRKMLHISENEFVVLGVGQLTGRKGVDDFIDIAESIPEIKFIWVGGRPFGGLTEGIIRIHEKISKAGDNFINTGSIKLEDMPYIYSAGDLMLFPSYQENCPLAPMEAAASGIPVIFRDIKEYESLYKYPYIKAGNNEEFIRLTRRMINDTQFYNEGRMISERLVSQFDKESIREELLNVYQSLLNGNVVGDFS
jgi:1,2-diacylglycerol-3-alpha-glucose alpha-1,2-galactosyltransferase